MDEATLKELAEADPRRIAARARGVTRAERLAQAVALRRAGLSFSAIGHALGCSEGNAHKLVKKALWETVATPTTLLIEQELSELESMRTRLLAIIDAQHRVVSAGSIVSEDMIGPDGNPVIDERTGKAFRIPLHNPKPMLDAIRLLLSVAESRRALLGTDAPKRVSLTDPNGNPAAVLAGMDQRRLEAALAAGLARLRAPAAEVVDVASTERMEGSE